MSDSNIVLKVTLPTVREGWYVFALAGAAAMGAVWPSAVVEAFEAGADVPAALAVGYAQADHDGGSVFCILPRAEGAPEGLRYLDVPRADGTPGKVWSFGAGRSRATLSADGRTVTVSGPMDSSVRFRANAHPRLMAQYRALEAAREAEELLAQARAQRPLAGRDCRELVRM